MNEKQMLDFIDKNVKLQGNQAGINLTPLLIAMVGQIFKDPATGVVPIVANIATVGEKVDSRTTYKVINKQELINEYIVSANETQAKTRLFVEDKGVLIGFNQIEIDELTLSGKVVLDNGEFGLVLSKTPDHSYFYHEEHIFEDLLSYSAFTSRITITVHQRVKDNIDNNPAWATVKDTIARKGNVEVVAAV